MIFVSTGGFGSQAAWKTALDFLNAGISSTELSGGLYDKLNQERLRGLSSEVSFQVHNYFPPPSRPFVFNLASMDAEISKLSIRHALDSMRLSLDLGTQIYSFHAGYLLDPIVDELGKTIRSQKLSHRKDAIEVFLENVNLLADAALKDGMSLLVENNVFSFNNHRQFGQNPFLMTSADECIYIMRNTPSNVNLLIDVAHLKVSANTMGYDPIEFLKACNFWINAYHLSDNDGMTDSNQSFSEESWFWPHLKPSLNYYSIEVYSRKIHEILQLYHFTQAKINNFPGNAR
jgi:sugar phosphate isomerase/epimerase